MTIPPGTNLTGARPKPRLSVSEMINCYNILTSYNTGSLGANPGGQVEGRARGGHDLPSRCNERLRDDDRSEVTAPQLLQETGTVAATKFQTFSAVDSVLTNEKKRPVLVVLTHLHSEQ